MYLLLTAELFWPVLKSKILANYTKSLLEAYTMHNKILKFASLGMIGFGTIILVSFMCKKCKVSMKIVCLEISYLTYAALAYYTTAKAPFDINPDFDSWYFGF